MSLTRRHALGAAVVAAIAPTIIRQGIVRQAQAAQPAAANQAPGFYRFKVGDLQVTAINDGVAFRPLDGFIRNAPEAEVRAALTAAFLPSDKMTIPFTTLVVNTGSKLVLLDTGNGDLGAPTSGTWMANFKAAGFDPANVDTVLISHFHGDHINGLRLKDGTAVFPKAEIMVPAAEWAFWMDDAKMGSAPDPMKPAFQNVRRVFGPIAKDVKQFEWGKEPVTGITTVAAPGHTPGHTAFALASGSGKLMVMSDTTNNPVLFTRHPDWAAVFDMDGAQAAATRRKMLDMAASDRMQVSFYHAAFPATGFIAKEGTAFTMVPVSWASTL